MLVVLLVFLSIGAFFGGVFFVLYPDGSYFGIPLNLLENSPFNNYFIPGLILLLVFGILPMLNAFALIKKPNITFFQRLNLLYDYHFSWTFSVYIGIALIIWINVQTLIFNGVDLLHTIYSSLGIVIICIALLPMTRNYYKL